MRSRDHERKRRADPAPPTPPLTEAAQKELDKILANDPGPSSVTERLGEHFSTAEGPGPGLPQDAVKFTDTTRKPDTGKAADDPDAIGGLRRTRKSTLRVPGMKERGKHIGIALDRFFDDHPVHQSKIIQAILTIDLSTPSG